MTDREKLARQWAELSMRREVLANKYDDTFLSEEERAAAEHILATTSKPTMADVDWDDGEHRLAGATAPDGEEMVMLWQDADDTGLIVCDRAEWRPDQLTRNGKRYELREVGEGKPNVRRARELVEDLAREHNLHSLTDGKLARSVNKVLDALAGEKPDHPEVLTTVEDYQNAPEGTAVAAPGYGMWEKNRYGAWSAGNSACDNGAMAKYECTVLRWGWGDEA